MADRQFNAGHAAWINRTIKEIINDLSIFRDGRLMDIDIADGYKWRIEMLSREIVALEVNGELDEHECKAVEIILKAFSVIDRLVDKLQNMQLFPTTSDTEAILVCDGTVGRPKFEISEFQLTSLLEDSFNVPDIARILGVSISTIRRRMTDFGLSVHQMYTQISSEDLQKIIGEVQSEHPYWGNRMMNGYLKSIGIRVPIKCIREAQALVDPEGSFMRRLRFLNRRRYRVPGPQWLWHIDGNHKLIR